MSATNRLPLRLLLATAAPVESGDPSGAVGHLVNRLRKLAVALGAVACLVTVSPAIDKTWDGSAGNNNFHTASNWTPSGVPLSADNVFIDLSSADVLLSAYASMTDLSVSNGAELSTNGNRMVVYDRATIDGASLTVNSGASGGDLDANFVDVKGTGIMWILGGSAQIDESLTTFAGSNTVAGYGTIDLIGLDTTDGLVNNGYISVTNGPGLTIRATRGATVDLDGATSAGIVNVINDSPLIVDAPLRDDFNGELRIYNDNEAYFAYPWTLNAARGTLVPAGKLEIGGGSQGPAILSGAGLFTPRVGSN